MKTRLHLLHTNIVTFVMKNHTTVRLRHTFSGFKCSSKFHDRLLGCRPSSARLCKSLFNA